MNSIRETEFTDAYIECALWASSVGPENEGAENFDLAEEAGTELTRIASIFEAANARLLEKAYENDRYTPAKAGHDLFLTQNGHGAGYWDRGLGDVGSKLSEWAKAEGTCDLYLGDDDKIHVF